MKLNIFHKKKKKEKIIFLLDSVQGPCIIYLLKKQYTKLLLNM